jgi:hypothetical protein
MHTSSSHLWLCVPSALCLSGFPNPVFFRFTSMHATCSAHLIALDLITPIIFGEGYKSPSSWLCSFLQPPVMSPLSGTKEVYLCIYLTLYFTYILNCVVWGIKRLKETET